LTPAARPSVAGRRDAEVAQERPRHRAKKAGGVGYRQNRDDVPDTQEIERLGAADNQALGLP